MPPTPERQLKFIRDVPFRNTIYHPASGQSFSVPLSSIERSQWTSSDSMPSSIKREVDTVLKGIYGTEAKGLRPDVYRFCWYETIRNDEQPPSLLTKCAGIELPLTTIGIYVGTLAVSNYA